MASTIQDYISPQMLLLTLMSESLDKQVVGVVFDKIPLHHRSKIKKMIKLNFPVHTGKTVEKVNFDKLIFSKPRGTCWGVKVYFTD